MRRDDKRLKTESGSFALARHEKNDIEKIELEDMDLFNKFSNPSSGIKSLIESEFDVDMSVRGNTVIVKGLKKNIRTAVFFIKDLLNLFKTNQTVTDADLKRLAKLKMGSPEINVAAHLYPSILLTPRKKNITPRTPN